MAHISYQIQSDSVLFSVSARLRVCVCVYSCVSEENVENNWWHLFSAGLWLAQRHILICFSFTFHLMSAGIETRAEGPTENREISLDVLFFYSSLKADSKHSNLEMKMWSIFNYIPFELNDSPSSSSQLSKEEMERRRSSLSSDHLEWRTGSSIFIAFSFNLPLKLHYFRIPVFVECSLLYQPINVRFGYFSCLDRE